MAEVLPASASAAEVVAAVERHQWELAIRWTRAQDGVVVDRPDLVRCVNPGVPVAFANNVLRVRLEAKDVGDAVRESTAAFREAGVPALWWTGPLSHPRDVGAELLARGWRVDETLPWMAVAIAEVEWPPVAAGLEIVRVADAEAHDAWLTGMTRGFSMTSVELGAMTSLADAVGYGEDAAWVRWAGLLDGRPVASSGMMVGGGVAGIYNVATAPEARRRGIGAAMTAEAVRAGIGRGLEVAVLGASDMGRGTYERMGFREVCRELVHLWPGTAP